MQVAQWAGCCLRVARKPRPAVSWAQAWEIGVEQLCRTVSSTKAQCARHLAVQVGDGSQKAGSGPRGLGLRQKTATEGQAGIQVPAARILLNQVDPVHVLPRCMQPGDMRVVQRGVQLDLPQHLQLTAVSGKNKQLQLAAGAAVLVLITGARHCSLG